MVTLPNTGMGTNTETAQDPQAVSDPETALGRGTALDTDTRLDTGMGTGTGMGRGARAGVDGVGRSDRWCGCSGRIGTMRRSRWTRRWKGAPRESVR